MKALLFPSIRRDTASNSVSAGLLLLRLITGIAFIIHGYHKIETPFSWMGPDAPVPGILQGLAAFAEFGGGISLIIGLLTRLSSLGLMITMGVAALTHIMKGDSFVKGYELAAIYFFISLLIFLAGPGKYSLDSKLAHPDVAPR